ncbi:MAG: hypothetical protein HAW66_10220, partial [Shewanella sp.]|nr:hypothetical protein [Shewanella sp.]
MKQFNPNDDYIQPPIIIIPGVGGTTLINTQGEVVYPGSLTSILFHNHNDLALMIENDQLHSTNTQLMPGSIVSEVLGTDIYASLMNNLERYGHYRKARLGEKFTINERRYYLFPYDWRQSSYDNALKLSDFIDTIQNDYQDPSIEVDIIAHSYGGLILRYFLRYSNNKINDQGVQKVTQAGAKKVRRLIQLGTPNLGSVLSIHHFVNGLSMLNFEITIPSIVSIPSIY